jgi:hypothetical protein
MSYIFVSPSTKTGKNRSPSTLVEDKNYFVIAWHEGRLCRERPSVQAARELFGEVRQSGEDRD